MTNARNEILSITFTEITTNSRHEILSITFTEITTNSRNEILSITFTEIMTKLGRILGKRGYTGERLFWWDLPLEIYLIGNISESHYGRNFLYDFK